MSSIHSSGRGHDNTQKAFTLVSGTASTITSTLVGIVVLLLSPLCNAQVLTSIDIQLSHSAAVTNQSVEVTGKLNAFPVIPDLSNLAIELEVKTPGGSTLTHNTSTDTLTGEFGFLIDDANAIDDFTATGQYQLTARFNGNNNLAASESAAAIVNVNDVAGYALIVQGKIAGDSGLLEHNKATNRIYQALISRGFTDLNILYYNYDTTQPGIVIDGVPDKATVQDAIENQLAAMANAVPAPIHIFMLDHGSPNLFHIGNETISATELDSWMDTMESKLNAQAQQANRVLIYGACYSGSFIPTLSAPGRILVTSAAADELSYMGPIEQADGIRSGEFFIDEFMQQLERGDSIRGAFTVAAEATRAYTRISDTQANSNAFFDSAAQHPLLDDDGVSPGANRLDARSSDGKVAAEQFLGFGPNFLVEPNPELAAIESVNDTIFLNDGQNSATLTAIPDSGSEIGKAWIEVRRPGRVLVAGSGSLQLTQVVDAREVVELFPVVVANEEVLQGTYNFFDEPGLYEIFYHATDDLRDYRTATRRSLVYKGSAGNQPPSAVNLLSPADASLQKTVMSFDWSDAVDADGDAITYTLEIATDSLFTNIIHRVENLRASATTVDQSAQLPDGVPLYWRVFSIDSSGGRIETVQVFSLNTNNTNGVPGIIQGLVYSNADFARLSGANISTAGGTRTAITEFNGQFYLLADANESVTLNVSSTNNDFAAVNVPGLAVRPGLVTEVNVGVDLVNQPAPPDPTTPSTGDTGADSGSGSGGGGGFDPTLLLALLLTHWWRQPIRRGIRRSQLGRIR
jgi:hypothetical protein